jgi:Cu+-exporting ATPase
VAEPFKLHLPNLTSDACAATAQRALENVAGVEGITILLADNSAEFSVTSAKALKDAFTALAQAGYPGALQEDRVAHREAEENNPTVLRRAFLFAACLTLPVFMLETGSRLNRRSKTASGSRRPGSYNRCLLLWSSWVPGGGVSDAVFLHCCAVHLI